MLKFRNVRDRCVPYLTCDCFGEIRVQASGAAVGYRVTDPGGRAGGGDVLFAREVARSPRLPMKLGCDFEGRQELFRFPSYVTWNVKLRPDDIVQALQMDVRTAALLAPPSGHRRGRLM